MAKKRETKANSEILTLLQGCGWFRNISDKFQIGFPDNIGSYRGLTFGIELKVVGEIPVDGLAPAMKEHRFSKTQVKELVSLQRDGGGVGLGLIICGNHLFWFTPEFINEDGQVDCNLLLKEHRYIVKTKETGWAPFVHVLELVWAHRMQQLLALIVGTVKKQEESTTPS